MPIIVNVDVMLAKRKMSSNELASKIAGFSSYATLRRRMEAPETMTLKELRKLAEVTRATDAEILRMVTGRRTR